VFAFLQMFTSEEQEARIFHMQGLAALLALRDELYSSKIAKISIRI